MINYTTFNDYTIINRNSYALDSVYASLFSDVNLGFYNDDAAVCNPAENYGMVFNGDSLDGNPSIVGYQTHSPVMSSVILDGPATYPNDISAIITMELLTNRMKNVS